MSEQQTSNKARIDGVVIGVVTGLNSGSEPLVAYSVNESELPVKAKSTVMVSLDDIGREVALLFEYGDPGRPIIMGLVCNDVAAHQKPGPLLEPVTTNLAVGEWSVNDSENELIVDGERIELKASREIVFKCGKASITMTRAGKVIIRGAYISTRSSGANRIKGGSVQIN